MTHRPSGFGVPHASWAFAWALVAVIVVRSGYAPTRRVAPARLETRRMGRVAVVACAFDPTCQFDALNGGEGSGAARGAGKGASSWAPTGGSS